MVAGLPVRLMVMLLKAIGMVLVGYTVLVFSSEAGAEFKNANLNNTNRSTMTTTEPQKSLVHLYFADRDYNFLMSEQRMLLHTDEPTEFAETIIDALIKGPRKQLLRSIPADTDLRAIYITNDSICYVDLSETVREKHPGGCNSEMLTIYSIVNSLILNLPEIEKVKILINGNEAKTLAGHCDLELPLQANMLLIR